MADDINQFSRIKEYVVVIPVAATTLAFSWEVGSFAPIGTAAFGFFSISEHIAFAVPALPYAFLFATCCSIGFIAGNAPAVSPSKPEAGQELDAITAELANLRSLLRKLHIRMLVLRAIMLAVGASAVATAAYLRSGSIGILGLVAIWLAVVVTRRFTSSADLLPRFFALAVVAIPALAFGFGMDTTRFRLSAGPPDQRAVLKLKDSTVQRVILRVGDRGILTFDPTSQRFSMEKWDQITEIDWPRTSLRPTWPRASE